MKLKLSVIAALFAIFSSCNNFKESGTVEYKVKCTPGGFDITYQNASGNTEQRTISSSSWSTSFTGSRDQFVYISAQANNTNASIDVTIVYQGKTIEEASSTGNYVIATASGTLP